MTPSFRARPAQCSDSGPIPTPVPLSIQWDAYRADRRQHTQQRQNPDRIRNVMSNSIALKPGHRMSTLVLVNFIVFSDRVLHRDVFLNLCLPRPGVSFNFDVRRPYYGGANASAL